MILTIVKLLLHFQTSPLTPSFLPNTLARSTLLQIGNPIKRFSEGDYFKSFAILSQEPLYLMSTLYILAGCKPAVPALLEIARLLCTMNDYVRTALHLGK